MTNLQIIIGTNCRSEREIIKIKKNGKRVFAGFYSEILHYHSIGKKVVRKSIKSREKKAISREKNHIFALRNDDCHDKNGSIDSSD